MFSKCFFDAHKNQKPRIQEERMQWIALWGQSVKYCWFKNLLCFSLGDDLVLTISSQSTALFWVSQLSHYSYINIMECQYLCWTEAKVNLHIVLSNLCNIWRKCLEQVEASLNSVLSGMGDDTSYATENTSKSSCESVNKGPERQVLLQRVTK